mgnify:CR=1 FL=1
MAIDTREKRQAAGSITMYWTSVSMTPNVAKDTEWRQESGWGYPGIVPAGGGITLLSRLLLLGAGCWLLFLDTLRR